MKRDNLRRASQRSSTAMKNRWTVLAHDDAKGIDGDGAEQHGKGQQTHGRHSFALEPREAWDYSCYMGGHRRRSKRGPPSCAVHPPC